MRAYKSVTIGQKNGSGGPGYCERKEALPWYSKTPNSSIRATTEQQLAGDTDGGGCQRRLLPDDFRPRCRAGVLRPDRGCHLSELIPGAALEACDPGDYWGHCRALVG